MATREYARSKRREAMHRVQEAGRSVLRVAATPSAATDSWELTVYVSGGVSGPAPAPFEVEDVFVNVEIDPLLSEERPTYRSVASKKLGL